LGVQAHFTGDLSDAELRAQFASCAVFVLPSITRAEAFGYVQLEAMASGKPVISTDLPSGVPWVNQDGRTGLVVPPGDPAALRAALVRLMADATLRRDLGAQGRVRVEREFSLPRLRERLRDFYAEMA
jgi:glycosyltransferase involved in cell wall biosynthesis